MAGSGTLAVPCLGGPAVPTDREPFGPFPTGTTICVDERNAGSEDGSPAHPFNTIQEGLGAAIAGDQVGVAPGTYFEHVIMKDGVDLVGHSAPTTTIDAGGAGSAVVCANAKLEGFTVTNAGGWNNSGINCSNGSSPTISNNIVAGNQAVGIRMLNSSATVLGNTISGNPEFAGPCPCNSIDAIQSAPLIFSQHDFG